MSSRLITTDLVALDADFGDSIESVITNLASLVHDTGRATSVDELAGPAIAIAIGAIVRHIREGDRQVGEHAVIMQG